MPQFNASDIVREFIGKLPMVAVANPRNPMLMKAVETPAKLGKTEGPGFQDEGFLHHANHLTALVGSRRPRITMLTNSVATLTALVENSKLVTLLTAPPSSARNLIHCGPGSSVSANLMTINDDRRTAHSSTSRYHPDLEIKFTSSSVELVLPSPP